MSMESLEKRLGEYLAQCSVPRDAIRAVLELRTTLPVTEAEDWWKGSTQTLLLIGDVGTGKSVAGANVLRHNWRRIPVFRETPGDSPDEYRYRSGVYVDMADISRRQMFDSEAAMIRHRAQISDLAILDDTGREVGDGARAIEDIFMSRYSNGMRTIITANLAPDVIKERFGSRVIDRIRGSGKIVNCGTESLRLQDVTDPNIKMP